MNYQTLVEKSQDVGLPVRKVVDMLHLLRNDQPIDNNELLRKVGVSRNAINRVKQELAPLLGPVSETTSLSPEGWEFVNKYIPSNHLVEEKLWEFLKGDTYQKTLDLLKKYQHKRPEPKRDYDQFSATLETTALRVALLDFLSDIEGKRLLFLGDDDLTSIGVAATHSASKVVVLDIDQRVLDTIEHIRNKENLTISLGKNDFRGVLPSDMPKQFDLVFTDPPYTTEGTKLFLSRAIQSLDPFNKAASIYLCYGNSDRAKERFLPVQKLFADSGLMLRWVFDKFNRYNGAKSIGSASSLFISEITPKTKPLITGDYHQPIYTYQ